MANQHEHSTTSTVASVPSAVDVARAQQGRIKQARADRNVQRTFRRGLEQYPQIDKALAELTPDQRTEATDFILVGILDLGPNNAIWSSGYFYELTLQVLAETNEEQESLLATAPYGAKDTSTMADIEHIVEKAQAEGALQVETPAHPAPNTKAELGAIATEAARLDEVLTALRERDIPLTVTEVEAAITGLHRISSRSDETAWRLGMHAVEKGLISQTQLAELMQVGQSTVSRRYREGLPDENELSRTDVRNNPSR